MKHTHMAVGMIPENLMNIVAVVHWTPGDDRYELALLDHEGKPLEGEYGGVSSEPFDYDPPVMQFDMAVYHGLANKAPLHARLSQTLGGFGFFQWISPAVMSNRERQKYGANK
ncbi:hypothetical protein ACFYW9_19195 [Streptomyces sp. NPDC002698]|uniref:hypothetical protein n=1 Tax=Streptomyces sp. NPDC002698 TaxID=3364660 RepID=UPI0036CDC7B7